MGEFITNIFNAFLELMRQFRAVDVLDIVVVAFLIYSLIKLVRETRAEQLVKGLLIMIIAWALSSQLNLKMIKTLLDNFFQFGIIALLVVFQPELRRALEHIGRTKIGTRTFSVAKEGESLLQQERKCINAVVEAAASFQKSKTGALIVFERQTKLGEIVDTGTIVNADPSAQIIGNIFFNKAPLHDGAMIIRNGMIYAAGCILPLTKNDSLSVDLG
ncbi:MAG: diadenylate cyclase, partial [[Clostridium] leptum]